MKRKVREPIQVYLTEAEREALDVAARELGVSRSEALRQGISALKKSGAGEWGSLVDDGILTSAQTDAGAPPPRGKPVAPWCDLMAELDADRAER
jgi:hypothetical protein